VDLVAAGLQTDPHRNREGLGFLVKDLQAALDQVQVVHLAQAEAVEQVQLDLMRQRQMLAETVELVQAHIPRGVLQHQQVKMYQEPTITQAGEEAGQLTTQPQAPAGLAVEGAAEHHQTLRDHREPQIPAGEVVVVETIQELPQEALAGLVL
jgi:hypothetical protein